jgi:hypothetical protein
MIAIQQDMNPSAIKAENPGFDFELSDDFIGVFDGLFSSEYCKKWINHFEEADSNGFSYNRFNSNKLPKISMDDQSISFDNGKFYNNHEMKVECQEFNTKFWHICYRLYADKYSVLKTADQHQIYSVKIQRTNVGQGYHVWHFEDSSRNVSNRILAFILYLNDINEGGETEFLYLHKRIKPVEGRMVIWPAGFTHTHRGNPPLKDTKYIMTGWVEF